MMRQIFCKPQRANAPNPPPLPAESLEPVVSSENLKLGMTQVTSALEIYDAFFTLPVFDVEAQLAGQAHWRPDTLTWIRTPWYAFDDSVARLRRYYDGSYISDTGCIGFAAAAFVQIDHEWHFAGVVSGNMPPTDRYGSYQAEVFAANLAAKLMYDPCKILWEVYSCIPCCEMIFDSLSVG